jgi:ABC-type glycerol-3-phosphate transport system substrate-binding protein
MRTTTATLATAAALLALTACSSSDDDSAAPAPTTSATVETPATTPTNTPTPAAAAEADLERVAETYTNLYFSGVGKGAYAFLSKRCQAKADPAVYEATVKQAATDYGPDHPATDVRATVSGDMGRVSYKVKGLPKFDQEQQPWAREGGDWKYDAC